MINPLKKIWTRLQQFSFVPMRSYSTTAPIHYILRNPQLSNIWGWKPFSTLLYAMPHLRQQHTALDTNERIIEIPWIFSQLNFAKPVKVLDVGWLESTVAVSLATAGFQVTGIDIRQGELDHPNLTTITADICQSPLRSNSFDVIILLSTLEHIGLETIYGKADPVTSDQKAIDECFRILKPGGRLLLTTPAAKTYHQNNFMRWYTPRRLGQLLSSWTNVQTTFYSPSSERKYWQKVKESALPVPPAFGVALVSAEKPGGRG